MERFCEKMVLILPLPTALNKDSNQKIANTLLKKPNFLVKIQI